MKKLKQPYKNLDGIENNFTSLYGEITLEQKNRYNTAFDKFKNLFNVDSAYIASSSGRVEVLGNHTDHNGGKVLSCAINLDTLAMFLPTEDNIITIFSDGYPKITVDLNGDECEEKGTSSALVRGVAKGFLNKGFIIGGFNAVLTSNVINGAGISSSASFEVLIAEIFNFLYNENKVSMEDKAVISQFAENVYFGKPCGLLDQTAISFGGLNKLDFKDKGKIKVTTIDNQLKDYSLVLINTGGSHENLTDEYASIPNEMFNVAKALNGERLIDVDSKLFFENSNKLPSNISDRAILRAYHFYEENQRVDDACDCLDDNDYNGFLSCVKDSGISSLCKLQNCFVAGSSCQVIPKYLSIAGKYLNGGVNRVHGGGFAGTILNIVKNDNLEYFLEKVSNHFGSENVIPLKVRSCGAKVL